MSDSKKEMSPAEARAKAGNRPSGFKPAPAVVPAISAASKELAEKKAAKHEAEKKAKAAAAEAAKAEAEAAAALEAAKAGQ